MERILQVLDRMVAAGTIGPYAIAGAVASYKYVEAAITEDLHVLVSLKGPKAGPILVSLGPVFARLAEQATPSFGEKAS